MRLPRILVIMLLCASLLAVLGAGAWWWVTWPERTMATYIDRVSAGRVAEATSMIRRSDGIPALFDAPPDDKEPMESKPRTVLDTVLGRQFFISNRQWTYCVQRGTISSDGPNWDFRMIDTMIDIPEVDDSVAEAWQATARRK